MAGPSASRDELARWEVFTAAARAHAEAAIAAGQSGRLPSRDAMNAARKACRNTTLPAGQVFQGSAVMRLLRLVDLYSVADDAGRRRQAVELRDLAIEAARLSGFNT